VRKSDALKLRPGQRIRFGDSMWSRNCDHNWCEGKVLFVTSQGGIRVQTTFGEQWGSVSPRAAQGAGSSQLPSMRREKDKSMENAEQIDLEAIAKTSSIMPTGMPIAELAAFRNPNRLDPAGLAFQCLPDSMQ